MALEMVTSKRSGVPIIEISGRIVDVDAKKFARKMEGFCTGAPQLVVIDVSKLNFIDSHGLGILIYHHNVLQRAQRELVVLNRNPDPSSFVRRLFELTNLSKVIRVVASLDELS